MERHGSALALLDSRTHRNKIGLGISLTFPFAFKLQVEIGNEVTRIGPISKKDRRPKPGEDLSGILGSRKPPCYWVKLLMGEHTGEILNRCVLCSQCS